jgi:hypothetical protein
MHTLQVLYTIFLPGLALHLEIQLQKRHSSCGALNPQVKTVDRPFMTRRFRKRLRHLIYGTMEKVKKEENKERTLFHLFCNHTFNIISVRPKNKDFLHV